MYILLYYENSDTEILVTYSLYANKVNNKHTVLCTVYTVLCAGVHCPTNNRNFCIKSEPVMAGADGTVNVQLLFRYKNIKMWRDSFLLAGDDSPLQYSHGTHCQTRHMSGALNKVLLCVCIP